VPQDPAAEEVKREVIEKVKENAGGGLAGGGEGVEAVVDIVGGAVEVIASDAAVEVTSAALEVGGEVVGGAMEALGSGVELLGGCAEGCSLIVAIVVLLAAAGSAMAFGLF
jgi:hypothetical protein